MKTVLVTGATGRQGGAVVRSLLATGWAVRALVRDPARGRKLGAELVVGDLDEHASLRAAAPTGGRASRTSRPRRRSRRTSRRWACRRSSWARSSRSPATS